MQLGTSPLTSTTHTCYQSQSAIGDIDLNVKLEQEEIQGNDENVQGNDESVQGNVRQKEVTTEQRRAIFDSLLARARNGNLRGHATTEVST
jgi:predicted acyltransferase (DUF342 family)